MKFDKLETERRTYDEIDLIETDWKRKRRAADKIDFDRLVAEDSNLDIFVLDQRVIR
jgi:hypothetical protein